MVLLQGGIIDEFIFDLMQIYKEIGQKYGVKYSENEILHRYRWAYEQPWRRSSLRSNLILFPSFLFVV